MSWTHHSKEIILAFHPDITRRDDVAVALDVANAAVRLASRQMTGNAGSVTIPNADGTKTVMGVDAGDAGVAPWVGDTTAPGTPTGVTAQSGSGMIVVSWDGTLDGGVPPDFSHVVLLVDGVESGRLAAKGSVVFGPYDSGDTHMVSAVAYDDAHGEDGSSRPNASAQSSSIVVTVAGSDIDPDKFGITITRSTMPPTTSTPVGNKGDQWRQYDKDPDAQDAALIAQWWWDGGQWVALPIALYLDQLASRGINADSAVIGLIAAGIITGGLFQTSSDNPRSYFDMQGFHTTDASGNLVFDTNSGSVNMMNATADNMVATNLKAIGGSITLAPLDSDSGTTLYVNKCETDVDLEQFSSVGVTTQLPTLSSEQHHSGSNSISVNNYDSAWIRIGDYVDSSFFNGGAEYTVDYWKYVTQTPIKGDGESRDRFTWDNPDDVNMPQYDYAYSNADLNLGWNHITYSIKVPYGTVPPTKRHYPNITFYSPSGYAGFYIDDITVTKKPFHAGSYYGLGDDGYPKLEMYGDSGETLISLKSSDSGEPGGKVVFATENGLFLGTNAQQPQLNITDNSVGITSSNRVDITAINDGVYVNSRKMGDSGQIDLSSYLANGVSGKLTGQIVDGICYLTIGCSGFSCPYGQTVVLSKALPSRFIPNNFASDRITGISHYYFGGVRLVLADGLIRFTNMENGTADHCNCTFTPYVLGK
jgi:hypothetical protein